MMHVAIINGGGQPDYLSGFVNGLAAIRSIQIDVIDSDTTAGWFDHLPNVTFHNFRGGIYPPAPFLVRGIRGIRYHFRLALYAARTDATVFHMQWEVRPYLIARFVLLVFYKILGKKIIFTAHNVDLYAREGRRGFFYNRSLKFLYRVVDRIIVHTQKMKDELCSGFSIPQQKVSVIRHGINDRVPMRGATRRQARSALKLDDRNKVILFFGNVGRYKNVGLLLDAFRLLVQEDPSFRLIVAGNPRNGSRYARELEALVEKNSLVHRCILRFEFIPYEQVEDYFMAADCLVLPYSAIFQSGVIFLAYRFGLPVVATDVGSFREDIVEGRTGFLCAPDGPENLAQTIAKYFESDLCKNLEETRRAISAYANERYAWSPIAAATVELYRSVLRS